VSHPQAALREALQSVSAAGDRSGAPQDTRAATDVRSAATDGGQAPGRGAVDAGDSGQADDWHGRKQRLLTRSLEDAEAAVAVLQVRHEA
jgi:hypothetical protein